MDPRSRWRLPPSDPLRGSACHPGDCPRHANASVENALCESGAAGGGGAHPGVVHRDGSARLPGDAGDGALGDGQPVWIAGEVRYDPDAVPYLKIQALTNGLNEVPGASMKSTPPPGWSSGNLKRCLAPRSAPGSFQSPTPPLPTRAGGLPEGHPRCAPSSRSLYRVQLVGLLGLANRPEGYSRRC